MKKGLLYLLIFIHFAQKQALAQSDPFIDSLKNSLRAAQEDTQKVNTLNALSRTIYVAGDFKGGANLC